MTESSNLIDETPEAKAFVRAVEENIANYKLSENEVFRQTATGVLSSTQIDAHGESFSLTSLQGMIEGLPGKIIWGGYEHDPLIPPVSRILAAKVFQSPLSGVGFIAGVIGVYSPESYRSFRDVGIEDTAFEHDPAIWGALPDFEPEASLLYSHQEIDPEVIQDLLAQAPAFVEQQAGIEHRKNGISNPTITILVNGLLLFWSPFSKKFLEQVGEQTGKKAADAASRLFVWLTQTVYEKLSQLTGDRLQFKFAVYYRDCTINFVIPSKKVEILQQATSSIGDALRSAVLIYNALEHLAVDTLTFKYEVSINKWFPLYAATKQGIIIADRPYLMVLKELDGLSIGAMATSGKLKIEQ